MPTISSTFQTSKPCDVDYLVQLLAGDRIAAQNLARIFLDVYPGKIDLELIEVQTGSYLGEDDIVRFEDTYGRA